MSFTIIDYEYAWGNHVDHFILMV